MYLKQLFIGFSTICPKNEVPLASILHEGHFDSPIFYDVPVRNGMYHRSKADGKGLRYIEPNGLTSKSKPASKSQFSDRGIGYRLDFIVPLLHPYEIAALTAVTDTEIYAPAPPQT